MVLVLVLLEGTGTAMYFGAIKKHGGTSNSTSGPFGDINTLDPCGFITGATFADGNTDALMPGRRCRPGTCGRGESNSGGDRAIMSNELGHHVQPGHLDRTRRVEVALPPGGDSSACTSVAKALAGKVWPQLPVSTS